MRDDVLSLPLAYFSTDVRNIKSHCIFFKSKDVVAEDEGFVATRLMEFDQVMSSHELVWIVEV